MSRRMKYLPVVSLFLLPASLALLGWQRPVPDSARLRREVAPFLVHSEEVKLLDPELMQQVVDGYDFA